MARIRSPNYPAIGLREAIRRAQMVYAEDGQNPAPRDVLVKHMGFSGVNGASLIVLSAVTKYGLLEAAGDKELRVSDLAMAIFYPDAEGERAEAIVSAADQPQLFREIKERWPGRPPSDDSLKAYLARRGFSQKALDNVIKPYRETIELVNEVSGEYNPPVSPETAQTTETQGAPVSQPQTGSTPQRRIPPPLSLPADEPMRVSITSSGLEVVARLSDKESVDKLIRTLEATKLLLEPVYGAMDTEYSDDEEGRKAEERDRKLHEEIDPEFP